jgi:hypothetical protein
MSIVLIGILTAGLSVNGVKLGVDPSTAISWNGAPASTRALEPGRFVAVRARGNEEGAQAVSIALLDAAVGAVTAVDRGAGTIDVLGQRVRVQPSTLFGPGLSRAGILASRPGARYRVSGLRAPDGSIIATRIETARAGRSLVGRLPEGPLPGERFVIEGAVAGNPRDGEFSVGGLAFGVDPGAGAELSANRLVRVAGRTGEDGRRVIESAAPLATPFATPTRIDRPGRPYERPVRGEIGGR